MQFEIVVVSIEFNERFVFVAFFGYFPFTF